MARIPEKGLKNWACQGEFDEYMLTEKEKYDNRMAGKTEDECSYLICKRVGFRKIYEELYCIDHYWEEVRSMSKDGP
jgi:hypothetical protein